ncbi:hypothetical protein W97_03732 [Coniosporium apollinis CBS 100218]|uniref:Metallo-beta-lactamase domain-containing protein n=1 Tax=Coniosporium apollinis (strain CBS 100218) TaxID=1168221 RepID=R7YRF9_CONA1|nr:uncharacterized protein W97_03732 [Coniosporium apollinis CBS 100218]EON64500.1 hypothetical protein W97_03732 [Coniosporium apollinis CBS 100218]
MPALSASNPAEVMVIRQPVPRVITTLSVPFWRFGRVKVGGRGTIVRLRSGALAVFSPVALTDEVKRTVSEMGTVKYITALDIEHHIFLGPWHKEYPDAKIIGPEGLPEKRAKSDVEKVPFAVVFPSANKESVTVDSDFDSEFSYEFVSAHANKELVFCHRPTRTLIEADLLFNLPATEQFSRVPGADATSGILTRLMAAVNHTRGEAMGQRRFIWWAISSGDRTGFNKSIAKINGWDFDRIVPCHGDVIESGGKGIFQKVMRWHLEAYDKAK